MSGTILLLVGLTTFTPNIDNCWYNASSPHSKHTDSPSIGLEYSHPVGDWKLNAGAIYLGRDRSHATIVQSDHDYLNQTGKFVAPSYWKGKGDVGALYLSATTPEWQGLSFTAGYALMHSSWNLTVIGNTAPFHGPKAGDIHVKAKPWKAYPMIAIDYRINDRFGIRLSQWHTGTSGKGRFRDDLRSFDGYAPSITQGESPNLSVAYRF